MHTNSNDNNHHHDDNDNERFRRKVRKGTNGLSTKGSRKLGLRDSQSADRLWVTPPGIDRKGTNGLSTNGVTANFVFFDRGTFGALPLTYFYLPKSARAYLFPQSVKIPYICSGPISVDPICPQASRASLRTGPTARSTDSSKNTLMATSGCR